MKISPEIFVEAPAHPGIHGQFFLPGFRELPPTPPLTSVSAIDAIVIVNTKLARAASELKSHSRQSLYCKFGSAGLNLLIQDADGLRMNEGDILYSILPKNIFLQDAFLLMWRSYGLNPNNNKVISETPFQNGAIRKHREYPSQTIGGLVFEARTDKIKATGQPTYFRLDIK